MQIYEIKAEIAASKPRSAWAKGVKAYALEMLEMLGADEDYTDPWALRDRLLDGSSNWKEYSEAGCALIYDSDIAARLCTKSELKRSRDGEKPPNSRQSWLGAQAAALSWASRKICWVVREQKGINGN